jgi:GNAT superfamily N-acetyltransferase
VIASNVLVRRARDDESDAVAALFRVSKETAMPYLPALHTAEDDRAFFRERVFARCDVWVAECDGALRGFCAIRAGWVDQLYVHPANHRTGIGAALLNKAKEANEKLKLWAFQRNANARHFYESQGFWIAKTTDGEDNEERAPDALYAWSRTGFRRSGTPRAR